METGRRLRVRQKPTDRCAGACPLCTTLCAAAAIPRTARNRRERAVTRPLRMGRSRAAHRLFRRANRCVISSASKVQRVTRFVGSRPSASACRAGATWVEVWSQMMSKVSPGIVPFGMALLESDQRTSYTPRRLCTSPVVFVLGHGGNHGGLEGRVDSKDHDSSNRRQRAGCSCLYRPATQSGQIW